MNFKSLFSVAFILFFGNFLYSQSSKVAEEVVSESKKLKKAVDLEDESAEANSYYNIGETYYKNGNFAKSEEYFLKSKTIYEKLNDKKNLEKVTRKHLFGLPGVPETGWGGCFSGFMG